MTSKLTPFLIGWFLTILSVCHAKVDNSDKNDVSNQNGTVQVLAIEDLNKTQYLNQNFRSGNYNYGYDVKPEGPNGQFHHENKAPDGVVFGCYGYVDPNDKPQITYYISDSWGYRPVTVGLPAKLYFPTEHAQTQAEIKPVTRSWPQLAFPKVCSNYEQNGATPLNPGSVQGQPPPPFIRTQAGSVLTVRATSHAQQTAVTYPGTVGKPGGPGILSDGGYGGEGGTGGLVSGNAEGNGGPGGNGGDGGTSSGSSLANGGNGGTGGHAGVASGSSLANGGQGGNGGDGGEASGSSNASGGIGGNGGKAGSASGSSNASGGSAGNGARGGTASGSSNSFGGNAGDGGDGGNASGSSVAKGGVGGTGGRGGTSSGSSQASGGSAGSGGRGGNASGSSSATAGDGGSAGNGGVASGSSVANGGSGGSGGSGAGAATYQSLLVEQAGYSYTPPKGHVQRLPGSAATVSQLTSSASVLPHGPFSTSVPPQGQFSTSVSPPGTHFVSVPTPAIFSTVVPPRPLPAAGGLLGEEQYTEEIREHQKSTSHPVQPTASARPTIVSGSGFQSTEGGYTYPTPPSQHPTFQTARPVAAPSTGSSQEQYYTTREVTHSHYPTHTSPLPLSGQQPPTPTQLPTQTQPSYSQRPTRPSHYQPPNAPLLPGELMNPPPAGQSQSADQFDSGQGFFPQKVPTGFGQIPIPSGIYVPPTDSSESGEGDVNGLGNDSGERDTTGGGCDQGYGKCTGYQSEDGIDYAQIPGAVVSNIPVIFYPDCRSKAYTRPAIVPFCPSQQSPQPTASCSHQQPLTMKFPTTWNPYLNIPSSRGGAYPSFPYAKSRPAKRVVLRSRRNHQSRYA